MNDLKKALKDYSSAIKLDSNYANAYESRGYVYKQLKKKKDAVKDFKKAISLDSSKSKTLKNEIKKLS